ncbi:unnamed protein product [Nesidiocoris tenuis]|uniref:Uncharacterized protein n=1 Tax=Nesidiocoris tenuis TaxID=355587 RepID=A0A6H5G684_9HEMI|nr:unnamed protein product [Nesidiocoris tenuis]
MEVLCAPLVFASNKGPSGSLFYRNPWPSPPFSIRALPARLEMLLVCFGIQDERSRVGPLREMLKFVGPPVMDGLEFLLLVESVFSASEFRRVEDIVDREGEPPRRSGDVGRRRRRLVRRRMAAEPREEPARRQVDRRADVEDGTVAGGRLVVDLRLGRQSARDVEARARRPRLLIIVTKHHHTRDWTRRHRPPLPSRRDQDEGDVGGAGHARPPPTLITPR